MKYTKKQVKRLLKSYLKKYRDVKYGVLTLKRKGRKQYKSYMKKIRHGLFKYRFVLIVYYGQYCTSVFIDKKGRMYSHDRVPYRLKKDLKRTGVTIKRTRSSRGRRQRHVSPYMLYSLINYVRGKVTLYRIDIDA